MVLIIKKLIKWMYLLVLCSSNSLSAQNNDTKFDSKYYYTEGSLFLDSNLDSALNRANSGLDSAKDYFDSAIIYNLYGRIYLQKGDVRLANKKLDSALKFIRKNPLMHEKQDITNEDTIVIYKLLILNNLAEPFKEFNNPSKLDTAKNYYYQVIDSLKKRNWSEDNYVFYRKQRVGTTVYNNLGEVYLYNSEIEKAKIYLDTAAFMADQFHKMSNMLSWNTVIYNLEGTIHQNLGTYWHLKGDSSNAILEFRKAINYFSMAGDTTTSEFGVLSYYISLFYKEHFNSDSFEFYLSKADTILSKKNGFFYLRPVSNDHTSKQANYRKQLAINEKLDRNKNWLIAGLILLSGLLFYFYNSAHQSRKEVEEINSELIKTKAELEIETQNVKDELRMKNEISARLITYVKFFNHDIKYDLEGAQNEAKALLKSLEFGEEEKDELIEGLKLITKELSIIENFKNKMLSSNFSDNSFWADINIQKVGLNELTDLIRKIYYEVSGKVAIEHTYSQHPNANLYFETDLDVIDYALRNIIRNAMNSIYKKFKDGVNGRLIISSTLNIEERFLSIKVADNGIGMSEEEAEYLFYDKNIKERMSREDSHGMGLIYCLTYLEFYNNYFVKEYKYDSLTNATIIPKSLGENLGCTFEMKLPIKI